MCKPPFKLSLYMHREDMLEAKAKYYEDIVNSVSSLIFEYGGIDGAHHKQWVLDQIIRTISKDNYDNWVATYEDGEDGPMTYHWDEGIAP